MDKIYTKLENNINDNFKLALERVILFLKENNQEYIFDKSHLINLQFSYYDDDYDINNAFIKGIKLINNELYVISHNNISYNYKNECVNDTIMKILKEIETYF